MRRRDLVLASLSTLPLTAASGSPARDRKTDRRRGRSSWVVHSQGCSSCPPADALLGETDPPARHHRPRLDVDYWNSLAARPYARREWTERQKTYAQHLRSEVFTPAWS